MAILRMWRELVEGEPELLESLLATPAENHSQLVTRLNRSSASVRADVDVLVNAGLVVRQEGLPNLTVPSDCIAIEYSIQADSAE